MKDGDVNVILLLVLSIAGGIGLGMWAQDTGAGLVGFVVTSVALRATA